MGELKMKSIFKTDEKLSNNTIKRISEEKESNQDIAIIGISINMPFAKNLESFRNIIKNKIDVMGELPYSRRQDIEKYLSYKDRAKGCKFLKGGFLEEISEFDYKFFKITPIEARLMNPVHRLILESTYDALDNAGYANDKIRQSETGVFVGNIDMDSYKYKEMILECEQSSDIDIAAMGNLESMIASRIAYFLDLKGPTMLIDTACSSALVAVHEACKSIMTGDCTMAVVSSSRISIMPVDDNIRIGMESQQGYVRAFDNTADGTSKGEGVISIVLKPAAKAIQDHDYIYALIKGSAINQDGTSVGISAPNRESQSKVIEKAWKKSGVSAEEIECIESHGTATKIGDVIETSALQNTFGKYTDRKQFCAISSVKSNFGHLYNAAGLVSIAKSIIQLKNQELLPSANFSYPNEKINFHESALYVNDTYRQWDTQLPVRTCGISAFGFSGTNCHMVLQEYREKELVREKIAQYHILMLSALDEKRLLQRISAYKDYIEQHRTIDIHNFCYTCNVCKQQLKQRVCIIFRDTQELLNQLEQLEKQQKIESRVVMPDLKDYKGELLNVYKGYGEDFINFREIDFSKLYKASEVRKIPVPHYQYHKERCWVKIPDKIGAKEAEANQYYTINWVKQEVESHIEANQNQKVILVGQSTGKLQELEAVLENNFKACRVISQLEALSEEEINRVDTIIYAQGFETPYTLETGQLEEKERFETGEILKLTQMLSKVRSNKKVEIIFLTHNSYGEMVESGNPANAIIHGFGKSINLEYVNCQCRVIDIDQATTVSKVIAEIRNKPKDYIVLYRNNERYIQQLDKIDMAQYKVDDNLLEEDGVYIITGGLGALGKNIAQTLSNQKAINIALIGRSAYSQEEVAQRCKDLKVKSVSYYRANIGDLAQLSKVIEEIKEQYKHILGVVHTAGVGTKGLLADKKCEDIDRMFKAKVYGSWNLLYLLQDEKLKFFILCSSGLTLMEEYGQAEYIAANTYLDAICSHKLKNIEQCKTVNWPVIKESGFIKEYAYENEIFESMSLEEVSQAVLDILKCPLNRIIIGKTKEGIDKNRFKNALKIQCSQSINDIFPEEEMKAENVTNTHYLNDFNSIQETLLKICRDALGDEELSAEVNLLDIGTDSIIFSKIHKQINEVYPNVVSVSQMFVYSSVLQLAQYIYDTIKVEEVDVMDDSIMTDKLNELITNLDDTSNEELLNKLISEIENL